MQLRQFNELEAGRRAHVFLTDAPPAPLASMPDTFTQQVTALGTTITDIDAQASAQTSATGTITDKAAAAKAAAKELRSGHLIPLRQVAKLITTGSDGASLSPEFPSHITVPYSHNYAALLSAASAAVQSVTPYKDLFAARGMPADFLDQITAQAGVLSQAVQTSGAAKTSRVSATRKLVQLLHELRSTMHVLDIGVTRACKSDRVNGATAMRGWKNARTIRKTPVPTDVPFAPPAASTAATSTTVKSAEPVVAAA